MKVLGPTKAALLIALGVGASAMAVTTDARAAPIAVSYDATAPCEIETTGVTPERASEMEADVKRALAACDAARERFAGLFGDPVPEVRVVLWDRPRYRAGVQRGRALLFWPSSHAMAARTPHGVAEEHVAAQWREVLPHELAHVLLAARFFGDGQGAAPSGYGTPLPDWLDEAVAIWAEPPASRRARVERALALPDEWLDLPTILASPHPATGKAAAYIARDGSAASPDQALWAFYQQSIAVLTFVYEMGGKEAVLELVRRLMDAPDDTHALAGLPGLPQDFDGVLAAWDAWRASAE